MKIFKIAQQASDEEFRSALEESARRDEADRESHRKALEINPAKTISRDQPDFAFLEDPLLGLKEPPSNLPIDVMVMGLQDLPYGTHSLNAGERTGFSHPTLWVITPDGRVYDYDRNMSHGGHSGLMLKYVTKWFDGVKDAKKTSSVNSVIKTSRINNEVCPGCELIIDDLELADPQYECVVDPNGQRWHSICLREDKRINQAIHEQDAVGDPQEEMPSDREAVAKIGVLRLAKKRVSEPYMDLVESFITQGVNDYKDLAEAGVIVNGQIVEGWPWEGSFHGTLGYETRDDVADLIAWLTEGGIDEDAMLLANSPELVKLNVDKKLKDLGLSRRTPGTTQAGTSGVRTKRPGSKRSEPKVSLYDLLQKKMKDTRLALPPAEESTDVKERIPLEEPEGDQPLVAKSLWEMKKLSGTIGTAKCKGCGRVGNKNSRCLRCGNYIPGKPITPQEGSWAQQQKKASFQNQGDDLNIGAFYEIIAEGQNLRGWLQSIDPNDQNNLTFKDFGGKLFQVRKDKVESIKQAKAGNTVGANSLWELKKISARIAEPLRICRRCGKWVQNEWDFKHQGLMCSECRKKVSNTPWKDHLDKGKSGQKTAQATRPPTEKQLEYCYLILKRTGTSPSDEDGQPLFETSFDEANKYIKANRGERWVVDSDTSAGDWGGIPNH